MVGLLMVGMKGRIFVALALSMFVGELDGSDARTSLAGKSLGEVVDPGTALPGIRKGETPIYFTPVQPLEGFKKYRLSVTPTSHKVCAITASGDGDPGMLDRLVAKYSAEFAPLTAVPQANKKERSFSARSGSATLTLEGDQEGYFWMRLEDPALVAIGKKEGDSMPNPIAEAFGQRLGTVQPIGPRGSERRFADVLHADFRPSGPYPGLAEYTVDFGAKSRRIFSINAGGPKATQAAFAALIESLEKKFGKFEHSADPKDPTYHFKYILGRGIQASNDDNGMSLSFSDPELRVEAMKEAGK
jgi:hypothetical protein